MERGVLEHLGFSSRIAKTLLEKLPKGNVSYKNVRILFVVSNADMCAGTVKG